MTRILQVAIMIVLVFMLAHACIAEAATLDEVIKLRQIEEDARAARKKAEKELSKEERAMLRVARAEEALTKIRAKKGQ